MDALQGATANPVDDLFAELAADSEAKEPATEKKDTPANKTSKKDKGDSKAVKGGKKGAKDPEVSDGKPKADAGKSEAKEAVRAKSNIDPANIVYIDLANEDNRKTVMQLMYEGKIMKTPEDKQVIVSFSTKPPYSISNPPAIKIYVDEIIHLTCSIYMKDLHNIQQGQREEIRRVYWAYHKGYTTHDLIDEQTFNMLRDEGLVKDIFYTYVDVLHARSYYRGTKNTEPTIEEVLQVDTELDDNYAEMTGKKKAKTYLPDSLKTSVPSIEEKEEELPPVVETNDLPNLLEKGGPRRWGTRRNFTVR